MDRWLQRWRSRTEREWVGRRGGDRERKEEERPPLLLSSYRPAAAHAHCELGADKGQSSQFIYCRMGPHAIWGVQSVSVHPAVPRSWKGAANTHMLWARQTFQKQKVASVMFAFSNSGRRLTGDITHLKVVLEVCKSQCQLKRCKTKQILLQPLSRKEPANNLWSSFTCIESHPNDIRLMHKLGKDHIVQDNVHCLKNGQI